MTKALFVAFVFCFPLLGFSQVSHVTLEVKKIPEPVVRDSTIDNWNRKFSGFNNLSTPQKEMLYWTNYARKNPKRFWDSVVSPLLIAFPQLNKKEAKSLKAELLSSSPQQLFSLNPLLIATSQSHASDITKNNLGPSHNSSSGRDFSFRMKQAGIKYCAGENIAVANDNVLLAVALLYLDIGVADLGHRKTLLNPSYTQIGIGASFLKSDQIFLVQDFSCDQN